MDNEIKSKKFRLLQQWANAIRMIAEEQRKQSEEAERKRISLEEIRKCFEKNALEFLNENPRYQQNSFEIEGSSEEDEDIARDLKEEKPI